MHSSSPLAPTRRPIRTMLRWLGRLACALGLLLLLGMAVLYAWIVPRLDQWRPELISYVQQKTGLDIDIERLQASLSANGLPVLEVHNARLTSGQAPWQVSIAKIQVGLSWQMLRGQPLGHLVIDQPQLQWSGASRPTTTPQAEPDTARTRETLPAAWETTWQWLLQQPSIRIVNGSVQWPSQRWISDTTPAETIRESATNWQLTDIHLELNYRPLRKLHQLALQLQAPQLMPGTAELQLTGANWQRWGELGWAAWPHSSDRWSLELAQLDLSALSELLNDIPTMPAWPSVQAGLLSLRTQGQTSNGDIGPMTFEIGADNLHWSLSAQTQLQLTHMRLAGALQSQRATQPNLGPYQQWTLDLKPSQFSTNERTWHSEPLQLSLTSAPSSHATAQDLPTISSTAQGMPLMAASLSSAGLDIGALSALLQASVGGTTTPDAPPHAATGHAVPASNASPAWLNMAAQQLSHWHQQLSAWQPSGQLQDIQIGWQALNPSDLPRSEAAVIPAWPWTVSARLHQLSAGMPSPTANHSTPVPFGIHNLSGHITSSPTGGSASLAMEAGAVQLATVFDSGPMAIDHLQTELQWTLTEEGGIALQMQVPTLSTPDAAGSANIVWRTSSPAEMQAFAEQTGQSGHALPGYLDLNAALTRADATAVWRYLPTSIPVDVRHYVREAIRGGKATRAEFEVRGDLTHFPFDARQRDPITRHYPSVAAPPPPSAPTHTLAAPSAPHELFRINADLEDIQFRYVPHYLLETGTPLLAWPDLQKVHARLDFIGNRMDLAVQSAQLQAAPKVRVSNGRAWIDDLMHAQLGVDVRAVGPLSDQLRVLSTTPVARMTDHVMDNLQGTGNTAFRLQLGIPLESHQTDQLRVSGDVQLKNNTLQWWPEVPSLRDVHGSVHFSDKGFTANNLQAQALGGPVTLDVVMADHVKDQPTRVNIDAQGTLSALGLQQYAQQALNSARADQWMSAFSGQTEYQLQVHTIGRRPLISLSSSLRGLASSLPYPFNKAADDTQALRLLHSSPDTDGLEVLTLTLGDRMDARYQLGPSPVTSQAATTDVEAKPSATALPEPTVLSGQLLIGQFSADEKRLPSFIPNTFASAPGETKVKAIVAKDQWDASEWLPWLAQQNNAPIQPPVAATNNASPSWIEQLIPDVWYGQFEQLQWGNLQLNNAEMQAYQDLSSNTAIWTTHFKADETQGRLEYHPHYLEGTGLLRGSIDFLELPAHFDQDDANAPKAATNLPNSSAAQESTEPSALANVRHLPTVDIEIGRLLFANRDWGKIAMQAMNRVVNGHPNEWIINYLTIDMPEARLTAKGSWQDVQPHQGASLLLSGRKKMDMQFTLEMLDAGGLLTRMGMPNLLNAGQGQLNGRLSWQGSPLYLDIPSLNGDFSLNVTKGQFLKASAGAGRLLGVMSLQALPRRLTLDFRDIFSEGFAFDFVRGDIHLADGIASTNNVQMQGVNAGVVLEGSANILQETQNITAVVVPELDAMTASLVATALNPAIGAGTFLAQFFFSKPLAQAAAQEFHIQGSWSDPIVERRSLRNSAPTP